MRYREATDESVAMAALKPANENPWYVLITLDGEQTGASIDWELHARNLNIWNNWACHKMTPEDQIEVATFVGRELADIQDWGMLHDSFERQHETEMKRRNGVEFVYPGFPNFDTKIDMSKTRFSNKFVFEGAIVSKEISFSGAHFEQSVDFSGTFFKRNAEFRSVKFCNIAYFRSVCFKENAFFPNARFSEYASFSSAQFLGVADFQSVVFVDKASFVYAEIGRTAYFNSVQFRQSVNFAFATFNGFVDFSKSNFGMAGSDNRCIANFSNCSFEKSTKFRETVFRHNYPEFSGAVLNGQTTFTKKPAYWPRTTDQSPEDAKKSCAIIRHALGKQGLPEDEHFFFRREMAFAGQVGGWWQRLPYKAFGWISDYGHSIGRPLVGLLFVWFVPTLIYIDTSYPYAEIGSKLISHSEGWALSFASIFKIFGFQSAYFGGGYLGSLPAFLQVLTSFQTICGFILLFFLGLGLRTRFRLR